MCLWNCPSRTRARATSLSISSCRETWKRVLRERESGAEEQSVFDKSSCPYAQMHNTDGNMCARMPDRTTKFSSPCSRNRSQAKQQPTMPLLSFWETNKNAAVSPAPPATARRLSAPPLPNPIALAVLYLQRISSPARARLRSSTVGWVGLHCCVAWHGQDRWGWSGAWWTRR